MSEPARTSHPSGSRLSSRASSDDAPGRHGGPGKPSGPCACPCRTARADDRSVVARRRGFGHQPLVAQGRGEPIKSGREEDGGPIRSDGCQPTPCMVHRLRSIPQANARCRQTVFAPASRDSRRAARLAALMPTSDLRAIVRHPRNDTPGLFKSQFSTGGRWNIISPFGVSAARAALRRGYL